MLEAPLPDDTDKDHVPGMHVGVAVVRLVRIVRRVVRVHVVRHGAPVNHEVGRVIGLRLDIERGRGRSADSLRRPHLLFRLPVNLGVHLAPLEQVFAVVAGRRVCRKRKLPTDNQVFLVAEGLTRPVDNRCGSRGQDNHCSIETHLDLQVGLRSAVVRVGARRGGGEKCKLLLRQEPLRMSTRPA